MSGAMSVENFPTLRRGGYPTIFSKGLYRDGPERRAHESRKSLVEQLLSVKDIQGRLRVSRSTALRFVQSKAISPVYVLGCVRFIEAEVLDALGLEVEASHD